MTQSSYTGVYGIILQKTLSTDLRFFRALLRIKSDAPWEMCVIYDTHAQATWTVSKDFKKDVDELSIRFHWKYK